MTHEKEPQGGLSLKTWARIGGYIKDVRAELIAVVIVMLITAACESSFPLFIKHAVNNFVVPEVTDGVLPFAAVFFAVILLAGVMMVFLARAAFKIELGVAQKLRRDCFVHLQKLPLSYYNVNSVGFLIARVMSDTGKISEVIAWGITHLAWSICYVAFCVIFMFSLSVRLALITSLIIPVAAAIAWFFQKRIIAVGRRVREINSLITGAYNEGITGSKTSKTLVIEDENSKEFRALSGNMQRQSIRAARLTALMLPLVMSLGTVAIGIILYRGGVLVSDSLLDYGILSAFITYAVNVIIPIVETAGLLSEVVAAQVGVERVTALLSEPLTITDSPEVIEKYGDTFNPKQENWEPVLGNITFENVWFKYPDGEEFVLEDFSLEVPAGSTIAIVGETGAGKSTIVNLACRFFEPTRGRVLIDGRDCRERSLLWLHSSLGYVLQDPHLFSGTIAENIRYGRLDASDDEIRAAAKLVSADIVAQRMPEGYDAQVGEGGDRLSTGEKQLVSFARAVLADPSIFVLDEATSSIDTETELLIQNAISHMLTGRTSFIIAHRLSTIARADLILVVEDGKIVERGTHSQLLCAKGQYSRLYKAMRLAEAEA